MAGECKNNRLKEQQIVQCSSSHDIPGCWAKDPKTGKQICMVKCNLKPNKAYPGYCVNGASFLHPPRRERAAVSACGVEHLMASRESKRRGGIPIDETLRPKITHRLEVKACHCMEYNTLRCSKMNLPVSGRRARGIVHLGHGT